MTAKDFEEAKVFYENNKNNRAFRMVLAIEVAKAIITLEIAKFKKEIIK